MAGEQGRGSQDNGDDVASGENFMKLLLSGCGGVNSKWETCFPIWVEGLFCHSVCVC